MENINTKVAGLMTLISIRFILFLLNPTKMVDLKFYLKECLLSELNIMAEIEFNIFL